MSIIVKENLKPNFTKVEMGCDDCINEKLNKYGGLVQEFLNQSNTTTFVGCMGQDKSSLMINFVKHMYKKCFHKIYLFIPKD